MRWLTCCLSKRKKNTPELEVMTDDTNEDIIEDSQTERDMELHEIVNSPEIPDDIQNRFEFTILILGPYEDDPG
jgi:hypothetical protein